MYDHFSAAEDTPFTVVNTSDWESGMYIITIKGKGGVVTSKKVVVENMR